MSGTGASTAGVNLKESQQRETIEIITPFAILAVITIVLRFYSRSVQNLRYSLDDWLSVAGLIFSLGCYTLSCKMVQLGSGKHVGAVPVENFEPYLKCLFAYEFVYATAVLTIKLSILLFYRRVFATSEFKVMSSIVGALVIIWWIAVVLVSIFSCSPINGFWDTTIQPKCIDKMKFFIGNAVPNIFTDVVILILPLRMIWRLNMSKDQKISLSFIFLLGSFVIVSSVIRLVEQFKVNDPDFTWAMNGTVIWTSLEPSLGVISACLPTFRPLLVRFFPRYMMSKSRRVTGYNSMSSPSRHHTTGAMESQLEGSTSRLKTTITSPQKAFDPEADMVLLNHINVKKDIYSVTETST